MAGTAEVLQEYLVKLGFQTDAISLKKFEDGLGVTGKKVFAVGTAAASAVVAVEAAAAAFAYSMRKIYFESELSNSSVKNINALRYAGKQIGITGDAMSSSIHGMAQAMRLNPGLQGLIESFGVKVTGRDTSDVMLDFVSALKNMPEFTATRYASMFGIDPDTYHQMISHLDELKAKKEEQLAMAKAAGVDLDAQKKSIMEYTAALDKLQNRFDLFGSQLLAALSPVFAKTVTWLDHIVEGWGFIVSGKLGQKIGGDLYDRWNWKPGQETKTTQSGNRTVLTGTRLPGEMTALPPRNSGAPVATGDEKIRLSNLEKQYGLPEGVLYKQWGAESGFGKNMISPAGAQGHFQFMPQTAKEFGLTNPFNFEQSSEAAARKLSGLQKRYKGDIKMALAAYNWGEGNLERQGIGAAPKETQDYVRKITGEDLRLGSGGGTGVTLNQQTTINVSGTGAPEIGKTVQRGQSQVNENLVRDMKGSIS